jgi:hypothetical protein
LVSAFLVNLLLLHRLVVKALTAHGLVQILPSDDLEGLRIAHPEGKASVLVAVLADGLEFLDLLCLGDELEDALEAGPQERAIEGRDDDDLPSVGCRV